MLFNLIRHSADNSSLNLFYFYGERDRLKFRMILFKEAKLLRTRDDRTYLDREDKNKFPGEIYRQVVLEPLFIDARDQLFQNMMWINQAHAIMLAEEGIVSKREIRIILHALRELEQEINWPTAEYDAKYEDLFFQLEGILIEKVGVNIAGQLHTGRSRNDIDATLYRMVLREKLLVLADQILDFRKVIIEMAKENLETMILGYTHTQPAQPTTLAHYLTAVVDFLQRDFQRLQEYFSRLNSSPMGAGALTTTSFGINRVSVANYLGFDQLVENAYDSVSCSDFLAEGSSVLVIMMTSLSRLLYDFLLFVMEEFNTVRLSEAYVQISSIMPQKRNPVSLEHSRALTTGILGQAQTVTTMLTNTPFGDIVDKEQELQRYMWLAWERASELYRLLTVIFASMEVNRERLWKRVRESFAVVTQLAETIVQYTDISFRSAHHIVSDVVKEAMRNQTPITKIDGKMINTISTKIIGKSLGFTDQMVQEALDPKRFVERRALTGGPAPEETSRQLQKRQIDFLNDEKWLNQKWEQILKSEESLNDTVEELMMTVDK